LPWNERERPQNSHSWVILCLPRPMCLSNIL
jgi:hypothetical protein